MNTLSNERLEQLAVEEDMYNFCPEHEELNALARELLALRKEREAAVPIYQCMEDGNWYDTEKRLYDEVNENGNMCRVLYTAPPAQPVAVPDIGQIRVGRLPTMNQDDYPGLGDWWVQLRIGEDSEEVLARVYGATPQEANNRAEALACRAAMLNQAPVKQPASNEGQP